EGPLVQAMRRGSWIVLDELNLAASDVLEALNRVLDDNRELFVAETQDTIRAHPHFMLFATQNPPGLYGGRKRLSRALRNRFVELHFQPIPRPELELILQRRCDLPLSRCAKLVEAMHQLQARRKRTGIFQGKDGFVTLRDLFRWAERHRLFTLPGLDSFFVNFSSNIVFFLLTQSRPCSTGTSFLAEQGYLLLAGRARDPTDAADVQSVLESVFRRRLSESELFDLHDKTSPVSKQILTDCRTALANDADAGDDKASHQQLAWTRELRRLCVLLGNCQKFGEPALLVGPTGVGKTTVCQALAEMRRQDLLTLNCHMNTEAADFLGSLRPVRERRIDASEEQQSQPVIPMFEWVDGVLVQAMRRGADLLVDEISLADDSVLERLNSVLGAGARAGAGRALSHRRRRQHTVEVLKALPEFRLVATMNPGGDFGKKELSPALRNRWPIWPSLWPDLLTEAAKAAPTDDGRLTVSARTALVWVAFVRQRRQADRLPAELAFLHGYQMTCLDPLGDAADQSVTARLLSEAVAQLRSCCLSAGLYTAKSFEAKIVRPFVLSQPSLAPPESPADAGLQPVRPPTPNANCRRLLRALQLPGSRPCTAGRLAGVARTSLVAALAKASGHRLVRINLSEHTDVARPVHLTRRLTPADQLTVAGAVYAELPNCRWPPSDSIRESMIRFNCLLQQRVSVDRSFGLAGSPWEFNLRDVFRWCEALRLHGDGGRRRCQPGLFLRLVYSGRMRCREDRRRVADLYREVFPDESANPVYPWPTMLHVTNTHVTVGAARVARQHSVSRISDTTNDEAYLLRHQLGALESLLHTAFGWPASLIGPEAAGKTRLVRLLAGLCGRRLRVMPLSAGMDTGDLVGGYEQTEPGREGRQLARRARSLARDAARLLSKSRNSAGKTALMLARKALGDAETEQVANESEQTRLLGELLTALEAHCPDELRGRLNTVARQWRELRLSTDSTAASSNGAASVRFRWRDSQLVRAVREGDWLLLDSANHCGVAVLDRLNSLLEPDGRLYLTERGGDIDGDGDEVSPHPEFRLFLASDPKFGELSRAMRNRCAEIWIDPLPPDGAADLVSGLGQSSATKLALRLHCSLTPTPPLTDLLSACRLLLRAADAVDASVKSKTRRKSKRRKLLAPDVRRSPCGRPTGCSVWCWKASTPIDNSPTPLLGRVRAAIDAIVDAGCSLSALPTGPVISPPPTPPIRLSELLADPTACLADAGLRLILSLAGPLMVFGSGPAARLDALAKAFADNQIVSSVFPAADIARLMSSTPAVHSIAAYCRRHDLVDLADP
uniref:Midasin n=1 Tax=Macrostomum lignano TaxID=282301 RepID=A0A1I8F1R9_9PLAT